MAGLAVGLALTTSTVMIVLEFAFIRYPRRIIFAGVEGKVPHTEQREDLVGCAGVLLLLDVAFMITAAVLGAELNTDTDTNRAMCANVVLTIFAFLLLVVCVCGCCWWSQQRSYASLV